jgi:stage II sporulation protein AB (anti-sigma F factor)
MSNHFRLGFLSRPENVGLARLAVATLAAQADFSLNDLEEVKVAVSEAVSNAIIHGYRNRPDGWVDVEAWLEAGELRVAVEDHGVGIEDIEAARRPAYSTDPERMGLGFVFMETFMDRLAVSSQPGHGTRVEMVRRAAVQGELSADAR